MDIVMRPFIALPCELRDFSINGIEADVDDFVNVYDHDPHIAEDSGCGDMCPEPKMFETEIAEYYGITREEYDEIVDKLCDMLNVGMCGWCV